MKKLIINGILTLLVFSVAISCADLNIPDQNNPDAKRALGSATDLRSVADGLYRRWYDQAHLYNGVKMALSTTADASTCSWGNQGMRWGGNEPRQAWSNASNYSYESVTSSFFSNMYSINSSAADVLGGLRDGIQFGDNGSDNAVVKAEAKLAQGLTWGYIALVFDQGYTIDENSSDKDIANPKLVAYDVVADSAISKLEDAAKIAANNSFTLAPGIISTDMTITNVEFEQIVHSYIARFLAYMPRNANQNGQVDWAKVQTNAEEGIDFDLKIKADGKAPWESSQWFDEALVYLTYPGWARMDMYVINMMDPAEYPQMFTANGNQDDYPAPDSSKVKDQRLLTDVTYKPSVPFKPERGYYHFSNFRYTRYASYLGGWDIGLPEFLKAENDMILAEAYAQQGMYTQAANIINNGTRVNRGGMSQIAPTKSEVMDAIHHERMVELFDSGLAPQFFEMRKNDLLQKGSILHFPLPAKTLETLGRSKPFYTFGGVSNADGKNTSDGGWK